MLPPMLGTVLNLAGILVGGIIGLTWRKALSPALEAWFKLALAACSAWCGLSLTWHSLGGSPRHVLKQILLLLVALIIGNLLGRLLRLQMVSNRIGQHAREHINAAQTAAAPRSGLGFKACTALFCAAPLGIIGAVVEGLSVGQIPRTGFEAFGPLGIKAVMDGLAAMGFAGLFGWGVMLSIIPVLVLQGTIALSCAALLGPVLTAGNLALSIEAAAGLLVFCVSLVVLGLKRVPLADYLPTLVAAPLLAWWGGW